jgi:hypothetical protein
VHQLNGNLYQPNTFNLRLKVLFSTFALKGIVYAKGDFDYEGGFGAYLGRVWMEGNIVDSTFGNRPTKYRIPDNHMEQCCNAILNKGLLDYSGNNVFDLHLIFCWLCCVQLLF